MVEQQIRKAKRNRAVGPDVVPAELMQASGKGCRHRVQDAGPDWEGSLQQSKQPLAGRPHGQRAQGIG